MSRSLGPAALLLVALSFAGCGGQDFGVEYTGGQGPPVDAALAQQGQALFARLCGDCHGGDGNGGTAFGASIQGAVGIASIVRNGTDGMPANALSDAQIASIEAYLAARAGAPLSDGTGRVPDSGGTPSGGTPSGGAAPGDGGNGGGTGGGTTAPDPGAGGGSSGGSSGGSAPPAPAPDPTPPPEDEDEDADEGMDED